MLRDELALGPAPRQRQDLEHLSDQGIKALLSLCAEQEAPPPEALHPWFVTRRLVLPDHRSGHAPSQEQLTAALETLAELSVHGPVFVHCLASMERSPLVCLAWLMRRQGLSRLEALDYLCQIHPGTNPLPEQLALL